MPEIRDKASNYLGATSNILSVPMCKFEQGDLLVLWVVGDTGAPTQLVRNTGTVGVETWAKLFGYNNTCSTAFFYKTASAAESDITVSSSVLETYDGVVMSIRDIDRVYPFGSATAVYNSGTHSTTRFVMTTLNTQRNNSLILHLAGGSTTAPGIHFVENGAHELEIVDGSAEGLGVGWSFQRASGTSANNVYCCVPVAGAGVMANVQILPPSGGAQVIPPYCVSDTSVYIEPNSAAANFDSNIFIANTADTTFGTSIGGFTMNDATVALAADIGVNSYHGMMGLTNAATANQQSGAQLSASSARYNIGSSNVLIHFRHPTPANNQRLTPLSTNRGVWMGMKSGLPTNLTNWKIWQVHGADVPIIAGMIQPIIINPDNTDTIATSGTLASNDVRNYGFWTGGVATLTQQTCIGPIWKMGTTTIAGGTAADSIRIPEIVQIAASSKERVSSVLQGANQMLCLQAIQFGDGGSNPVYLNLDSTAVEFPRRKDVTNKAVNYNGTDNSIGFTYYPGPTDTIIHKDSIISSPSRYHWRIHASANTGSSYNFSGLTLIGAGDVVLKSGMTFDGMTFNSCSSFQTSGSTITNSVFKLAVDALIVTGTGDMNKVTACQFLSCTRGIKLEQSGTYAFNNITFGGNTYDIHNSSGGNIVINATNGSNPITSTSSLGGTVTINNTKTLTLTGLITGTEVRLFNTASVELSGVESSTTSFVYSYNYTGDLSATIIIHNLGYIWQSIPIVLGDSSTSIPIQQQRDRQYFNPA